MRLRRLDLVRYGRFTEVALELPPHNPDIHIVFGPNEAGKSTALSALEDLLFGIPKHSPLNFLHDYGSMRIGALLESNGEKLELRRRKGNKDTLLTPDEIPLPEGDQALAPYLAGADRGFFVRMLSLDHQRLRQGGRDILEARDEVGQMLFSAGAGIEGLRERLAGLQQEADELWASRRATRRKYYQVEERLQAAENALRERTVTASKWQDLKRAYDGAREAYAALEQEIRVKAAELRKLSRIRRVYRDVRRRAELEAEIRLLGEVTLLPADSGVRLQEAEREDANATARIETLGEQLEAARKERLALRYDERLVRRAEDISQLHERRIQVRVGQADLPRRRAQLAVAEADLRRLGHELDWDVTDIEPLVQRIPVRPMIARIRSLLNRRGEQLSTVSAARAALAEAEARCADLTQQLMQLGAPADASTLAAVIRATRASGDIAARIETAEAEATEAQLALQRQLASMNPAVGDQQALVSMVVPPRDTVQSHRDVRRDLDHRLAHGRERIRAEQQKLYRQRKARERVVRDGRAVPPEQLARLRYTRDAGWSLIRRRYLEGISVPDHELCSVFGKASEVASAYEAAVSEADRAADRRFQNAEAAAQLVVLTRQITEQEDLLEMLGSEQEALVEESQTLDASWQDMWSDAPFRPLPPDTMLEWMAIRTELIGCIERRVRAEQQLAILRREEDTATQRLSDELDKLAVNVSALNGQPLRVVLEVASEVQSRHAQDAEARHQFEDALRKARNESQHKRKALEEAERTLSQWETQWRDGLDSLGLAATARPEAVSAQIEAIDEMRDTAVRINELRHERIGAIERDVAAFGREVVGVVDAVAPDLKTLASDEAVLELERRLEEAKRIQGLQKRKDEDVASLEGKLKDLEAARHEARDIIRNLEGAARVERIDELRNAVARSDRLRALQVERSQVTKALIEEGDGLSTRALQAECDEANLDQVGPREDALGHELDERRERLMEARERLTNARQSFEAIGGDDAAASAAADRQGALAEMEGVAEQYVRVRSAALLLQWGIERYRREKQAPLLRRAGELFAMLTEGSFTNLALEFDQQDRLHLAGLRPDGARIGVEGMSTGTADQLYLALRVAAVEDYLQRAKAPPFIADDLFINFDDGRAAAGFEVLGQLARSCQVIFFTHHQHLLEIARLALAGRVSISSLPGWGAGAEARS